MIKRRFRERTRVLAAGANLTHDIAVNSFAA